MGQSVGGFFDLELAQLNNSYHKDALALNTARNALEYILRTEKFQKIYLPYFTCEVLLEPINKLNIIFSFYSIDANLEPIFDYSILNETDAFLYTNYFGLKNLYVQYLSSTIKNLIVDNAQAFFVKPFNNELTFYSARKFFGVADGAFLYTSKVSEAVYDYDTSYKRMSHLLIRKDTSAEDGYNEFVKNDKSLENNEIKFMSKLTSAILCSIDYNSVVQKRIENFRYLDENLKKTNKFNFDLIEKAVPMVYPYWTEDKTLKNRLQLNRIYCATYWPNVKTWCENNSLEYKLSDEVVYLPIDQRYGIEELNRILENV
jgi:hypothetical protein